MTVLMPKLRCIIVPAGALLACWPVLPWYFAHLSDGTGEIRGVLALGVAFFLLASLPLQQRQQQPVSLLLPALLILVYGVAQLFVPPLIRGIVALGVILATFYNARIIGPPTIAITGLFLLAFPVVTHLQFYCGYPLRLVCGYAATALLSLNGFAVHLQGAGLTWNGSQVWIDAPCGGVHMLWTGYLLAFAIAGITRMGNRDSALLALYTLPLVLLANIMRISALFYMESGILDLPAWMHSSSGIILFFFLGMALLWIARQRKESTLCAI